CGGCDESCPFGQGALCIGGRCAICADGSCRLAFVSSSTANGAIGGLDPADARCQSLAQNAGLLGTYRAWLSTNTVSAAMHLNHSAVPYRRTDGVLVAND